MRNFTLCIFSLALFALVAESRRWAPSLPAANRLMVSHPHRKATNVNAVQECSSITGNVRPVPPSPVVSPLQVASMSISQRLLGGGCSRGVAQMIMYPMDALRTLAQTRDGRTLADVGAKALVRGCAQTSTFAILIGSVQFAIFGATRDACGPIVSSALGAAGSCIVSIPQEVIKQRLVTGVYTNFRSAVATIYKTEGVKGFYSAWRPTVARNVPMVVATFTAMDFLKHSRLQSKRNLEENANREVSLTVTENLLIGVASALIGSTLTHPVDVIKTRLMTQAASTALPYKSTIDCIQTIWKTEGIKSFYSGFVQRSIYTAPLWAIQFALNGKFTSAAQSYNLKAMEMELEQR